VCSLSCKQAFEERMKSKPSDEELREALKDVVKGVQPGKLQAQDTLPASTLG